ncbi:hypothetical protein F0562_032228 [Nyssa sinensis]|uniref:Oligosaccharyl transferase STT3 N-terminal domain-containing protein n=1 Tax=Nyssa sinensis TaxID=561372 RepID=A0A5J5B0E2_9ASTE|nr:hypothetical protein F0562_032228 [Nyssa sinensis]
MSCGTGLTSRVGTRYAASLAALSTQVSCSPPLSFTGFCNSSSSPSTFANIDRHWSWLHREAVNTGSLAWALASPSGYFDMVSAWGGYVFIINLIPLNAMVLLITGRSNFSGSLKTSLVPPELTKLSLFQGLWLQCNALKGVIPENVYDLKIFSCSITGSLVQFHLAVSKLELLSYLDRSGSKLNGSILESMAKLCHLMLFDLSHNHLTGSILGSMIASLKSMQICFNLLYNFLVGSIPDGLGMLEMVQAIDISNNNLSGSIPRTLESCKNLFSLDLSGNKLFGPTPGNTLSQINMLRSLNLSSNQLYGEIPKNLANLP